MESKPKTAAIDNIWLPAWKLKELRQKEHYACFVDKDLNVYEDASAREKLNKINDQQYVTPEGIVSVSRERWQEAQQYERKTWMEQCVTVSDDRNYDHLHNFSEYDCLKEKHFERVLELGCGPFTNLRLILPLITGVKKVTLLDPLIESYVHHPNCTYKDGFLAGHPVDLVASGIEDYNTEEQFDLVIMINVLEHCYNVPKIFSRLGKLLKQDGIFIMSDVVVEDLDVRALNVYDAGHPIRMKEFYLKDFLEEHFTPVYWKRLHDATQHSHREICHYFIGSKKRSDMTTDSLSAVNGGGGMERQLSRPQDIQLWRQALTAKQSGDDRACLYALDTLLATVPEFKPARRFMETINALPHVPLTYTDVQDQLIENGYQFHDGFIVMERIIRERGLKLGAELGVFQGYHTLHLLQSNPGLRLYCVDAYRQLKSGIGYDDVSDAQFEELYQTVLGRLSVTGRAQLLRATTAEAAASIPGLLDFVYIDAEHTYEGVINDFIAWYPLVRIGGIIAGHDYDHPEWPGVKRAIAELMPLFGLDIVTDRGYVWWAEKTEDSLVRFIGHVDQLPPEVALKLLLGILDHDYDSSALRMALAKTYLRLDLPSQAREFLKTVTEAPDRQEAELLMGKINPDVAYILPDYADLEEDRISGALNSNWVIASAASSSYFPQLVNLIGSLHRHCLARLWKIVVYDLGLSSDQVEYLGNLALVTVKVVPAFNPHGLAWWNWKLWLLRDCAEEETVGPFMYFDAGTEVQRDLAPIFELIQREGYALWHAGGHLNRDWTTTAVYEHVGLVKGTDTSLQLLATVQGYAARGIVRIRLVDAAFEASWDERLLRPATDCPNNRHDQSLLSLLIKTNNITLYDPDSHIAWENADHDSAFIWLCRHRGIMHHNDYLKKKKVQTADLLGKIEQSITKTRDSNAETIAEGEEALYALSATSAAGMANDVLKNNAIAGAFHNDIIFQSLFDMLIRKSEAEYIVETGTFLGWTTSYLAQNYTKCKIITTDSNSYFNRVSQNRLNVFYNIDQILKSSDSFIDEWLATTPLEQKNIFFLDAHWENYWPLPNEIKYISEKRGSTIIIIDDFKVMHKPEYGYDDYGNGKIIDLPTVATHLDLHNSYKCLLPDYFHKEQVKKCQHLRGRCVIFQNCDDLFTALCNDVWVKDNFSNASNALNELMGKNGLKAKIVALMPVKNEANSIAFFLRAIAKFTDAICIYDDASDDDTMEIVAGLARECRVEKILRNKDWVYNETNYRQPLLDAGREIGGTHFIIIDADEAFTANFCENNLLREKILKLKPGDQLSFAWIQLWRSTGYYRYDKSVWTNNYKGIVFCDDGKCYYHNQVFHLQRVPANLIGNNYTCEGYSYGLLHFQFVNWRNLLVKQAWYRCLERIRNPAKPLDEINALYAPSKDENGLGLVQAPDEWFASYDFFDASLFAKPEQWREKQVIAWFDQYGRDFFSELDIWDINWCATKAHSRELANLCAAPQTDAETTMLAATDSIGGWFSTQEILALYRLVKLLPGCAKVLEIGSYRGRSTNAIGYAMEGSAMELYCLDVWRDFVEQGIRQTDTTAHTLPPTDYAIFEDYLKNVEKFGDKVRILRGSTQQFANLLPERFFDLIFVDGAHDYENVHRDITAALRCVNTCGLLCGHDYHADAEGVIRAVEELVFSNDRFVEHGVINGTSIWFARYGNPQKANLEDVRFNGASENFSEFADNIKKLLYEKKYEIAMDCCLDKLKLNHDNEQLQDLFVLVKSEIWKNNRSKI